MVTKSKVKEERLKVYSVRLEQEVMQLAKFYKIDVAALFRNVLTHEIGKRKGKCSACGSPIKWRGFK